MVSSIFSQLVSSNKLTYAERWSISNQQSPHITCIVTSTIGPWLASASKDSTLLFVDINSGSPLGIVDFENQFFVLCALWRTSSTLLLGCSNGVVYELVVNPHNVLHPASMYPILGPMSDQIRAIAFDSSGLHAILAVGYATRVSIYAQTLPGHEWNKVDDILEPCHAASGLVAALFFFGKTERKLFIGYAEEGWTIWRYGASSDLKRVDPEHFLGVCRIGQACLSPDQEWVSISTLNQSVVVYALGDNGPILESAKEFPLQVTLPTNPVLPVAHTSTDLVLGGTSDGDIPIVKSRATTVPRLHQGEGHLIRSIATHNNDVIVGSTGPKNMVTIKCFRDGTTGKLWMRQTTPPKPFRVSLGDVLVMSTEAHKRTAPKVAASSRLALLIQSNEFKMVVGMVAILTILVLSSDPPGGVSFQSVQLPPTGKGVKLAGSRRQELWVLFGIRYFSRFAYFQVSAWSLWAWSIIYAFIVYLINIPAAVGQFVMIGIAKWVCERVELYRSLGVCPQLHY